MQLRSTGKEEEYKKHNRLAWIFVLLEAVVGAALLLGFLFRPVSVCNNAMAPTLRQNEVLLVDRVSMYLSTPGRGSIQLLPDGCLYRVVAYAGERVELINGQIYVNSRLLDESPYLTAPEGHAPEPVTVPEGAILLLPDDRSTIGAGSSDPGSLSQFMIPLSDLRGTVRLRVSPLDRINLFVM